jgi:hypothetical protein
VNLVGRHVLGQKLPEAPEGDLDFEAAGDEQGGVFEEQVFIHAEVPLSATDKLRYRVIIKKITL